MSNAPFNVTRFRQPHGYLGKYVCWGWRFQYSRSRAEPDVHATDEVMLRVGIVHEEGAAIRAHMRRATALVPSRLLLVEVRSCTHPTQ